MMNYKALFLSFMVGSFLLTGCSFADRWVYRPDINQGNYLVENQVKQLQEGMTKEQVMFLLGSPMLTSMYGDNVWYYVFRQKPQHKKVTQKKLILTFNEANVLVDNDSTDY